MAEIQLAKESPDHSLQPTALVHEVYLRWAVSEQKPQANNREHFFALAAEAMRHILIDHARRKKSQKRGGTWQRIPLTDDRIIPSENIDELLAIDEAIGHLGEVDSEAASLVRLRYYGGLSVPETAAALGVSRTQAYRLWVYARACLLQELKQHQSDQPI
jgi:RNA polymerase sigma factor (TIGR02999 family)